MNRLQFVTLVYISWIVAHYVASHMYVKLCTPATLAGFLMSPFNASSPQCIAIRWVICKGGNNIGMMWLLLGMWLLRIPDGQTENI